MAFLDLAASDTTTASFNLKELASGVSGGNITFGITGKQIVTGVAIVAVAGVVIWMLARGGR